MILPVLIQDDVWIGTGAIILKGVTVGTGSIVAVGAVLRKMSPNIRLWEVFLPK